MSEIGGGELVGVLSAPIPLAHSVANMEALARQRAVEFATELRLQRVIFEGDSTIVINAIIQGTSGFSTYGNVVEDIRCQATLFQSCMFNHVNRFCNCVADALARKAKSEQGSRVWLVNQPEDISSLLFFDVH